MRRQWWGLAFLFAALVAGGFLLSALLRVDVYGLTHPRVIVDLGLFFGFLVTAFSLLLR